MRILFVASSVLLLSKTFHESLSFIGTSPALLVKQQLQQKLTSLSAISVLARKAKEAEIQKLKNAGIPEEIQSKLDEISSEPSIITEPTEFQKALTKRKGTITVIAEYKRRVGKVGYVTEVLDPDVLSTYFREFGAAAVAVLADERMGGCTYDDLKKTKEEQETARGDVPGPCFVISSDLIVDEIQLAQSAIAGADAVVLTLGVLGQEKLKSFINAAKSIGLDVIVNVSTRDEANQAIQAGGRIICVSGIESIEEKNEVVSDLEIPEGANICTIASILVRDNEELEEIQEAWILRDKGFNSVWVSDCLYKSGQGVNEHPGAIIRSIKAKSSVKYASVKAMGGKGEGATEYLGDLLM